MLSPLSLWDVVMVTTGENPKISMAHVGTPEQLPIMRLRRAIKRLDRICIAGGTYPITGAHWWVGLLEDRVVCYCGLKPLPNDPGLAYLCRAGVSPAHRGRGLQRRMIRLRVRFARDEGFRQVVTDCSIHNGPSLHSLFDCGFRLYEPQMRWSGAPWMYLIRDV